MTRRNPLPLFGLMLVCSAALADPAPPADRAAPQLAARESALDWRQVEERLYRQGYHRISHLRMEEAGLYSARALDRNGEAVFLGVAPDSGQVVEALPLN